MLESEKVVVRNLVWSEIYSIVQKGIKKPQIKTMETTFTKKIAMEATAYIKQTCKLA